MNRDYDQPWVFFWAPPDSDFQVILEGDKESTRKLLIRRALLNSLFNEADFEEPPQAG
ncbi:MAG: hypothetical protein WCS74_01180 [Dehalococcoidales bacterium]|jgi:hypothetical protein|nr:hypothetical protein [Dehalococcoidales bacterium]MDD3264717.1 hypothetical protein [Dehalococcoidales bacterium]MDD4322677.1 hypothetical protein [Dehalococcoidales bacterium]MDD4794305.1 hypothetical protein [Dehalococcoidales bacterium]MDD5122102.1 hypothetical protein [Dehalococcoidales bacterium]